MLYRQILSAVIFLTFPYKNLIFPTRSKLSIKGWGELGMGEYSSDTYLLRLLQSTEHCSGHTGGHYNWRSLLKYCPERPMPGCWKLQRDSVPSLWDLRPPVITKSSTNLKMFVQIALSSFPGIRHVFLCPSDSLGPQNRPSFVHKTCAWELLFSRNPRSVCLPRYGRERKGFIITAWLPC